MLAHEWALTAFVAVLAVEAIQAYCRVKRGRA